MLASFASGPSVPRMTTLLFTLVLWLYDPNLAGPSRKRSPLRNERSSVIWPGMSPSASGHAGRVDLPLKPMPKLAPPFASS